QPTYQAYARSLEQVVATSPVEHRAFWDATRRLASVSAAGGIGSQADGAQAFQLMAPAAAMTQQQCAIDIMGS
ncbi:MAG: hypothetical protein JWM90_1965, partial [Thermoleophilia bacterium]|nr:hypothetical protein [Thermoleophilia bacterium]